MNKKILILFLLSAAVMPVPTIEAKKNIFQKIGKEIKKGGKKVKKISKKAKKKGEEIAKKTKRKAKEAVEATKRKAEETARRARSAAESAFNRVVSQAQNLVSKADRLDNEIAQYFQKKQAQPGSKPPIPAKKKAPLQKSAPRARSKLTPELARIKSTIKRKGRF